MSFNDRIQKKHAEEVDDIRRQLSYWFAQQHIPSIPDCPESRIIRSMKASTPEADVRRAWAWLRGGAKMPEQVGGAVGEAAA